MKIKLPAKKTEEAKSNKKEIKNVKVVNLKQAGTKKVANVPAKKKAAEPEVKAKASSGDGSTKMKVYTDFKAGMDIAALIKKYGKVAKETTLKGWTSAWKNGKYIPTR